MSLKISQLTSGNPAQAGDLIPIDRAGSNFSLTAGAIAALAGSGLTTVNGVGMLGPGFINGAATTSDQNVLIGSNNQVHVYMFTPLLSITITKVKWHVSGGANGTKFAFGIYSADGNTKLLDTGAITVAGVPSDYAITVSSVTLNAGTTYFFAQTATGTLAQGPAIGLGPNEIVQMNASTPRYAFAANSSAAGVLPATLGVLTADNSTNTWVAAPFFEP